MNEISSNSLIAQNTALLYIRMALIMLVQIYTSRIILMALGASDYGIYNVVGGIVVMFGFLNGTLSGSTQRYITYELGKGNGDELNSVFVTAVQLHFLIAIFITLIAEPIGLWLIHNKMQIPPERMTAAIWVFHLSIASFFVSVISVPYNSAIIAHERISVYAYISIIEVIAKLAIVYLLLIINNDRLILYALLVFSLQLIIRFIYIAYCKHNFTETKYKRHFNFEMFKEMFVFSGWNFIGNFAAVLNAEGLNVLLNVFFGPLVNAARAISVQVQVALNSFYGNLITAVNPVLTKSWAQGEYKRSISLMQRTSKFSFYLLFLVTLPVLLEADQILEIWLKDVPELTPVFVKIILVTQLIFTFTSPMTTVAYAAGNIKKVNLVCGAIVLMVLPISWLFLNKGAPAYVVFVVYAILELISFIARTIILKPIIGFSIYSFIRDVIVPCVIVTIISSIISLGIKTLLNPCMVTTLLVCISSMLVVGIVSFFIGMSKDEKRFVIDFSMKLFKRKNAVNK